MDLERYVKVYSKNSLASYDDSCYKINSTNDLNNVKIPNEAFGFCVFYKLTSTMIVNGKKFNFSYEQTDKAVTSFFAGADEGIKFCQIARAVEQFPLPKVQSVEGTKGKIKRRFVERHFTSCHPEFDTFEERDLPKLDRFLLPKAYERAELIEEYVYPIIVDGKQKLMRSQPISKQTYYVGTIENLGKNSITFTTLKGGLGFAKPDDIIVDPSQIDDFGRIINTTKKL